MPIVLAYAEPPAAIAPAPPRPSVITQPDWVAKPNLEDLRTLYPPEALKNRVEGRAIIHCDVNAEGALVACSVVKEDPLDLGFGDAAMRMANLFRMRPQTRDGLPTSGGKVNIPILFTLPPPTTATNGGSPPQTPAPDWRRKPTGENLAQVYPAHAARANIEGRGIIRCEVTAEGTLTNCFVLAEGPSGEGFGEAALKLAKYFVMRPMTKDGVPVAGGVITIPIRFQLPH
jgi:TonB family protein